MRQCRRAGFKVFMLAFFILALVVSAMAAEVPDPTACDKDGATARKGRPGVAPVEVRDGVAVSYTHLTLPTIYSV